jgi:hypothetical protein
MRTTRSGVPPEPAEGLLRSGLEKQPFTAIKGVADRAPCQALPEGMQWFVSAGMSQRQMLCSGVRTVETTIRAVLMGGLSSEAGFCLHQHGVSD